MKVLLLLFAIGIHSAEQLLRVIKLQEKESQTG